MALTFSQSADFQIWAFNQDLTIFTVHELMEPCRSGLAKAGAKVLLDLSAVEDIDSAGLQLVWWLSHQLQLQSLVRVTGTENTMVQRLLNIYQFEFPDNLE
ncbi:STAS domain-containing protein [Rheinheimera sp.]|uniref:STAS domain-containing protein n=1 Tax=Rheinheimera sp. TaxID=1869214 RepID=UPI00307FAE20